MCARKVSNAWSDRGWPRSLIQLRRCRCLLVIVPGSPDLVQLSKRSASKERQNTVGCAEPSISHCMWPSLKKILMVLFLNSRIRPMDTPMNMLLPRRMLQPIQSAGLSIGSNHFGSGARLSASGEPVKSCEPQAIPDQSRFRAVAADGPCIRGLGSDCV